VWISRLAASEYRLVVFGLVGCTTLFSCCSYRERVLQSIMNVGAERVRPFFIRTVRVRWGQEREGVRMRKATMTDDGVSANMRWLV